MRNSLEVVGLEDLGTVRVRGPDAVRFLQGQLSNDISKLSAGESMLAGYHNPQGRTIALLRLVLWEPDDILAVVPRDLAGPVSSRLARFVLRAKVRVTDESGAWRTNGVYGGSPAAAASGKAVPAGDSRWLTIAPADGPDQPATAGREAWERLEVESGQPQVYAATSEEFVAQMLNLDAVNAISFEKGCYTGQEVIARAHYRGRVKRRMQRFISRDACVLKPGDAGQLPDGRIFKVVRAAQLESGRCDFLAVAPITGAAPEESQPAGAQATLAADVAPLPYALPD